MKKQYAKVLLVLGVFMAVALLYIPFRLFAQRFNSTFPLFVDQATGEFYDSDNFYHWFSVLVWPAYALLSGFCAPFVAKFLRIRWWLLILLFIIALLVWDQITVLDDWFNIPGGGLCGFRSYRSNHRGMSTPELSVILCPITFLVGAVVGTIAGHVAGKTCTTNGEQDAEGGAVNRSSGGHDR